MKRCMCLTLQMLVLTAAVINYSIDIKSTPMHTPDQVIMKLKEGNRRYVAGTTTCPRATTTRRLETAREGQHPLASILSCSDSRVPVEIIFDQGIGDIFSVRVAGNVAGIHEIGSLEYGVDHLKTPVIVVLGHSKCGAVTAAAEDEVLNNKMDAILKHIKPLVKKSQTRYPKSSPDELIRSVIIDNVKNVMGDIINKSPVIKKHVNSNDLKVVGAILDLESGQINWLD